MEKAVGKQGISKGLGIRAFVPYAYIFPSLLIYAIFVVIPILGTILLSFFDWTGFSSPVFVGFKNFVELSGDQTFLSGLFNNFSFIFFYTVLPVSIGLILTMIMSRRNLAGQSLFRAGFFIPYIMPMVVVGVIWRWIYNPAFGPLNQVLKLAGLGSLAKPWLGDFNFALPAVGVMATWVQYGFCMALFLAGVQRINEDLFDAAKVDGANQFQQMLHVMIPGIRGEILVAVVTTFIAAVRLFDLIFVTTRGGPGAQTVVTSLWLYRNAFQINRAGYGAAIAVVQTAFILLVSFILVKKVFTENE